MDRLVCESIVRLFSRTADCKRLTSLLQLCQRDVAEVTRGGHV